MKQIPHSLPMLTRHLRQRLHVSMCAQFRVADDDSPAVDTAMLRTRFIVAPNLLHRRQLFTV